jgi:hypothetical protein
MLDTRMPDTRMPATRKILVEFACAHCGRSGVAMAPIATRSVRCRCDKEVVGEPLARKP